MCELDNLLSCLLIRVNAMLYFFYYYFHNFMFSVIVTKSRTMNVLMNQDGATDYDGTLHVVIRI